MDTLLEAFAAIKEDPWRLDIAGVGPLEQGLQTQATVFGISDRVAFHGWLERGKVSELYESADALVLSSLYEGMPNVVLEAMAMGLPVVGTRIMGTEELIEDGENGLLVPTDDAGSLAAALRRIAGDRDMRLRMGDEGRRRVEEKWSWKKRAEEFVEIAERGIAENKRR